MKRKNYSKRIKNQGGIGSHKRQQTANEIASEFGIHANLVNRWKEAIEALPLVFGDTQAKQSKEIERERESACIRRLANFRSSWTG